MMCFPPLSARRQEWWFGAGVSVQGSFAQTVCSAHSYICLAQQVLAAAEVIVAAGAGILPPA